MKCKQARQKLNLGEQGLPLSAHLVLCGRCRAEARTLQEIQLAISEAGRFAPPPALLPRLLAIAESNLSIPIKTKTGDKMTTFTAKRKTRRRLHWVVYVIAAALVAAGFSFAFLALPQRHAVKPKPPVSNSVIPTNEQNTGQMVHIVMPIEGENVTMEIWSSPDNISFLITANAGSLFMAGVVDPVGKKEWAYSAEKKALYEADLTHIAVQAADILVQAHKLISDQDKVKKYDHKFAKATYDYTTPVPPELASFQPPPGTKIVRATAKIERGEKQLALVMEAEGGVIMRTDIPLDK